MNDLERQKLKNSLAKQFLNNGEKNMDFLAQKILQALAVNIDDKEYLTAKKEEFKKLDRLGAARQIANLDTTNQETLAKALGVAPIELEAFNKVLGRL